MRSSLFRCSITALATENDISSRSTRRMGRSSSYPGSTPACPSCISRSRTGTSRADRTRHWDDFRYHGHAGMQMRKTVVYKSNLVGFFIIALTFMTVFLIWMIKYDNWSGIFMFSVFIVIFLRFLILIPHTVILQGSTVSETSLLHKKTFEASQVQRIVISRRLTGSGSSLRWRDYVEVHTKNDHVISFEYFYGKSPDVYEILQG